MKLLILTQYYPPETGAPQNRLHQLALHLKDLGVDVEVLTAMPNYPKMEIFENYRSKVFLEERIDGVKVHRSRIYAKNNAGIGGRLLNYYSFVWSSFFTGWRRLPAYDYIMVESPPLFLGKTAWLLCKLKGAKMIFNVSDLWPESAEKLGLVTNRVFLRAARGLEEFLYRESALITGQTRGIVANISSRFPQKRVHWLPNGVDPAYFDQTAGNRQWRIDKGFREDELLLLYAGIIGHAQGLEVILEAAAILQEQGEHGAQFILLGDGPRKADLIERADSMALKNVHFFDPVTKADIPDIIKAIDVAVVPLRKLPLFEGAIPSKIFENLALEKPLLLGVDGEARALFIEQGRAGLYFTPEDHKDLAKQVLRILRKEADVATLGSNGREYVQRHFNRKDIARGFFEVLQSLQK